MRDQPIAPAPARRVWYRPMLSRGSSEEHRASTPLELFFDRCFVVAVAQAAAQLHHALASGQVTHGLVGYAAVFFAWSRCGTSDGYPRRRSRCTAVSRKGGSGS